MMRRCGGAEGKKYVIIKRRGAPRGSVSQFFFWGDLALDAVESLLHGLLEDRDGPRRVLHLVDAEEPDAERRHLGLRLEHVRHARGDLEPGLLEAARRSLVAHVRDDDAGRAVALRAGLALFATLFCSQNTNDDSQYGGPCNQSDTRE
jgi:hypothetical protein